MSDHLHSFSDERRTANLRSTRRWPRRFRPAIRRLPSPTQTSTTCRARQRRRLRIDAHTESRL